MPRPSSKHSVRTKNVSLTQASVVGDPPNILLKGELAAGCAISKPRLCLVKGKYPEKSSKNTHGLAGMFS